MIVSGAFAWLSFRQAEKSKTYQERTAEAAGRQAKASEDQARSIYMQEARQNGRLHLESAGERTLRVWNPGLGNLESIEVFCTAMENPTVSLGRISKGEFADVKLSRIPSRDDYLKVTLRFKGDTSALGRDHRYDVAAIGFTVGQ